MWRQVLVTAVGVWACCGSTVFSQQDPDDLGLADSVYIEVSQAYRNGSCGITVDVFYFDDVQTLMGGGVLLSWDHPGLEYDSVASTPLADSAFDLVMGLDKSTAQQNKYQAFATIAINLPGLSPAPVSRKMGSIFFHLNDWDPGDAICFDTTRTQNFYLIFFPTNAIEYTPVWPGRMCLVLGECNPTAVEPPISDRPLPAEYLLSQNYPNPFNPSTTIDYTLPTTARIELVVLNELGQRVTTLASGLTPPGRHQAYWNGCNDSGEPVASGVYLYRLSAGEFVHSRKMLLLK